MAKQSLLKNSSDTLRPTADRVRGFIPFREGISLKESVIARLELELSDYDVTVQYPTGTPVK